MLLRVQFVLDAIHRELNPVLLEERLEVFFLLASEPSLHDMLLDKFIFLLNLLHDEPELATQRLTGATFSIELVSKVLAFDFKCHLNIFSLGKPLELIDFRLGFEIVEVATERCRLSSQSMHLFVFISESILQFLHLLHLFFKGIVEYADLLPTIGTCEP